MKKKSVFSGLKGAALASLTLLILLSSLAGCLSKAKRDTGVTPLDTETVVIKDLAASSNVALRKEWSETVNGRLKAHIILRNKRNTTIKLSIKTVFKDEHGVPIKTSMDTWDPVMIQSNEDYHYSKLCLTEGAAGYQFIIKTAGK